MKSLFYSYERSVESAYIITVPGHLKSQQLSLRCQDSCKAVSMPYKIWDAFDGTKENNIIVPDHSKNDSVIDILKITDHYLTRGEVACALSHISLWRHCAQIDKPIVILEHDAVMLKKFEMHQNVNSIVYLGGAEWVKNGWPVYPIPPHASEGPNYHFICRAHAYAIDPQVAKNLLAHVIKMGIVAPLDIMMRVDLFNVTHQGLYAYDDNDVGNLHNDTTIKERPKEGRTTVINSDLKY
jgi:GR25 family glycosyltransferase involved in LPS biosynthesis